MSFSIGNVATLSVGGTDISEYCKSVSLDSKRDEKKLPRLGGAQTAKLPGPIDATFKVEGWYDPALAGVIMPLHLASPQVASAVVITMQSGETYSGNMYVSSVSPSADSEDPEKFDFDLLPDADGYTYA